MCEITIPCTVLTGLRIRLRPFDASTDAQHIFDICSSEETVRFYGMKPMEDVSEAESLLSSYAKGIFARTSAHWAIVDVNTEEVIGDAGLMSIDGRNRRASSYCILASQHWGKGLSREAMKILFDHAFSSSALNRIQAYIDVRNERTIRSVRGIGFIQEGVLRDYEFDRDEFIDDAVFALTRLDWCRNRHVVFGTKKRAARQCLSWQFYTIDGIHYVWIYNNNTQRYYLLSDDSADLWLNDNEPEHLLADAGDGFAAYDAETNGFISRLNDNGIVYEVHWDITNVCNSHCKHCYNHGAQNGKRGCRGGEMSTTECREALKAMREQGVFRIVFSGGEPLVRTDALELLRFARNLGFQVVLYTNGILVDEQCAKELATLCLASVEVSAYGACAATHENVTEVKGSFDKSMNALRLLSKQGIHTVMKCVALHSNFAELGAMQNLGSQIAEHTLVNYVFYPGMDGGNEQQSQMLRMPEIIALAMNPKSELYHEKSSHQLCRYEQGRECVCTQALKSLYMNAHGDIFPCIAVPQVVENWQKAFAGAKHSDSDLNALCHWKTLRFADIPKCGKRDYCAYCYSACPGDGFLINGSEYVPPTNHCRLAIGRYVASKWLASKRPADEWRQIAADEDALVEYLNSLGICRSDYEIRGIV